MSELIRADEFSYSDFLKDLSTSGRAAEAIANEILRLTQEGRVKIEFIEGLALSTVSLYTNGSCTIFLPRGYNREQATTEAPRLLMGTLFTMRNFSKLSSASLEALENQLREELKA